MKRLVVVCDRCADDTDKSPGLKIYTLTYSIKAGALQTARQFVTDHTVHWCRKCVQEVLGEFPALETDPVKPDPPLSVGQKLEALIRDIVYEEADEVINNS